MRVLRPVAIKVMRQYKVVLSKDDVVDLFSVIRTRVGVITPASEASS